MQLTSEWVASFDLGLSVSVPVLFIRPDNVYLMGDEGVSRFLFYQSPTQSQFFQWRPSMILTRYRQRNAFTPMGAGG